MAVSEAVSSTDSVVAEVVSDVVADISDVSVSELVGSVVTSSDVDVVMSLDVSAAACGLPRVHPSAITVIRTAATESKREFSFIVAP